MTLVQSAADTLNNIQTLLARMLELGCQASSDTVLDGERYYLDYEYQALKGELSRLASTVFPLKLSAPTSPRTEMALETNSPRAIKLDVNVKELGLEHLAVNTKLQAECGLDNLNRAIESVSLTLSVMGP
jgi:flagellin